MSINDLLNTPADLYYLALECLGAWENGRRDAIAAREQGAEMQRTAATDGRRRR